MSKRRGWTRRAFLERGAMAGAVVAIPALAAGCQEATKVEEPKGVLARARERGYINVGFAGEAPFAFLKDGALTGEEPAVHKDIWNTLGVREVRGVQVDFAKLIEELNANRFDVVCAGMFIRPARCEQASFSEPIYTAPQAFLVRAGNPAKISSYESVTKANVGLGLLTGGAEVDQAKKSGVPTKKIVEFAAYADGLSALTDDRVAAFGLTSISLRNLLKDNPTLGLELTKPFIPVIDGKQQVGGGAAAFRKEDDDARQAFNTELAKLKRSGKLLELIQPFGFGPETIPSDGMTTAMLCQV